MTDIQLQPLTKKDIPLGMRLKSLANWNQLELDWQLLIKTGSGGNFVATYLGTEAGTTTTITYQNRFSWIGMVLVDPAFRGLGIGTYLLKKAIDYAKFKGTVRLDATPQGKKLYETLGFETERNLLRLERKVQVSLPSIDKKVLKLTADELPEISRLDLPVFGADRKIILNHLAQHFPQYGLYITKKGKISSYCLGRSGSNFEHIGPVIADNEEDALNLILSFLESCQYKRVIIDVFEEKQKWFSLLKDLGFEIQRPFIRMYLGDLKYPGIPERQFAIAGPELG